MLRTEHTVSPHISHTIRKTSHTIYTFMLTDILPLLAKSPPIKKKHTGLIVADDSDQSAVLTNLKQTSLRYEQKRN